MAHGDNAEDLSYSTEFLLFTLGNEEYAIDILKVQEIRGYEAPTTIANAPSFIKGVINLRGVIVPIIDLRIKFALPIINYSDTTVVIILAIRDRVIGIVVDAVSDVMAMQSQQIRPPPSFSATVATDYIAGLATLDNRMLTVVNIESMMLTPEMALANAA